MNARMLAKYWRTILVVAEMNFRQQMTDGFILFTMLSPPNQSLPLVQLGIRSDYFVKTEFLGEISIEKCMDFCPCHEHGWLT